MLAWLGKLQTMWEWEWHVLQDCDHITTLAFYSLNGKWSPLRPDGRRKTSFQSLPLLPWECVHYSVHRRAH